MQSGRERTSGPVRGFWDGRLSKAEQIPKRHRLLERKRRKFTNVEIESFERRDLVFARGYEEREPRLQSFVVEAWRTRSKRFGTVKIFGRNSDGASS